MIVVEAPVFHSVMNCPKLCKEQSSRPAKNSNFIFMVGLLFWVGLIAYKFDTKLICMEIIP
ncbi:hypothetical protein D9M72_344970 [compost metagenome]